MNDLDFLDDISLFYTEEDEEEDEEFICGDEELDYEELDYEDEDI